MSYIKLNSGLIKRIYDSAIIPVDSANQDYMDYLTWVADGNLAEDEPDDLPINVLRITRAQGKKHLLAKGKYTNVKEYIDSENCTDSMRIGFYDEEYWLISDDFVLFVASLIGWDSVQLQDEFNQASKL